MKWHLYKRDDPNTWPQVDCKFIVCDSRQNVFICNWNNDRKMFFTSMSWCDKDEYYYGYISFMPSGYTTKYPIKCMNKNDCYQGYNDDGYCVVRNTTCKYAKIVPEYTIKEELVWKEFE